MADLTLAVAGHAENDLRNVEALLSDWLELGAPDSEGYYETPGKYKKINVYALFTEDSVPAGMKPALDILPFIEGVTFEVITHRNTGEIKKWSGIADSLSTSDDPMHDLVQLLAGNRSSRLLMNWDENDADDERLIKLAHEAGVRVQDLVNGLVEIVPDEEEEEPQEEPQAKPEPVRKRRKKAEELDAEPQELDAEPEATPAPAKAEPVQLTAPVADTYTLDRDLAETILNALALAADYHNHLDVAEGLRGGIRPAEMLRSHLTQELANSHLALSEVLFGEEPYADSPPKTSPGKDTKVIWDEATSGWKKAGPGRPRRGSRVGMMNAEGVVTEIAA